MPAKSDKPRVKDSTVSIRVLPDIHHVAKVQAAIGKKNIAEWVSEAIREKADRETGKK